MRLISGIDPDSLLQGGWQSASERLKMAAAQVNDPGSDLRVAHGELGDYPALVAGGWIAPDDDLVPTAETGESDYEST